MVDYNEYSKVEKEFLEMGAKTKRMPSAENKKKFEKLKNKLPKDSKLRNMENPW